MSRNPRHPIAGLAWLLLGLAGCGDIDWWKREPPPEPQAKPAAERNPILAETIGEKVLLGDAIGLRLRGFGVVIGLGENGGSDCPSAVREYLLDYLAKEFSNETIDRSASPSPQRLIDSPDTAVVVIDALVPGGSAKGAPLDVRVEALGAQTRSLEGGVLLTSELRLFEPDASGQGMFAGAVLARASGNVFTNPFAPESEYSVERRRGIVLGGGRTLADRPIRLLLTEPSYTLARRVQSRINERFGQSPPVAEAVSAGYVRVVTPRAYRDRAGEFIRLVLHLPLSGDPGQIERKLRDLETEVRGDASAMDRIALIWEAVGRPVAPHLQKYYEHEDPLIRFYAARAGLRCKDARALPVLGAIAGTPEHPQRVQAIRELGESPLTGVGPYLAPLLNDADQSIRIEAYEAARRQDPRLTRSAVFESAVQPGALNLVLDIVQGRGDPFIYVCRSREPRVAVFGEDLAVVPPVFYSRPDDLLTINAGADARTLTVFRKTPRGRISDKLAVPPYAAALIATLADLPVQERGGAYRGLGLPHGVIVQALHALTLSHAIPARLVLEQTSVEDLLGPAPTERPESDEAASQPDRPIELTPREQGEAAPQRQSEGAAAPQTSPGS